MPEVIHIEFNSKSVDWNSGLFLVVDNSDTELICCKLDRYGNHHKSESGHPMLTVIGKKSDMNITETQLKYQL